MDGLGLWDGFGKSWEGFGWFELRALGGFWDFEKILRGLGLWDGFGKAWEGFGRVLDLGWVGALGRLVALRLWGFERFGNFVALDKLWPRDSFERA